MPRDASRDSVRIVSRGAVYLAGGGPGTLLAMRRHFKAALEATGVARPLVAYVGAASDDDAGFFTMIRAGLAPRAARMRLAKLASPGAKASEARALLEDCDLVFISGGDVDHGMRILHERDVAPSLRRLASHGKPMFGISAGSLMLAREWVRFEGEKEDQPVPFPCLGVVPFYVDAHSEDDDWEELRILLGLVAARGEVGGGAGGGAIGYGLTRKGALRVTFDGEGEIRLEALETPIPRLLAVGARVVHRSPIVPVGISSTKR
jgi:peptidase E